MAIVRQLKDIFHVLSPNVAVAGLTECFAKEFDVIEFTILIDKFCLFSNDGTELRKQLQNDLRQKLRQYLKDGVPFVLNQEDFIGGMKADLAMALARVGEPEDIDDLHRLIQADIERVRNAQAASARGELSAQAKGGVHRCANQHVRAVAALDPVGAEAILLALLDEPEYESDAAAALLGLATIKSPEKGFIHQTDYGVVWQAREGHPPKQFDEERRKRYAAALQKRLSTLLGERVNSSNPKWYEYKLTALAKLLANLDSSDSAIWFCRE